MKSEFNTIAIHRSILFEMMQIFEEAASQEPNLDLRSNMQLINRKFWRIFQSEAAFGAEED